MRLASDDHARRRRVGRIGNPSCDVGRALTRRMWQCVICIYLNGRHEYRPTWMNEPKTYYRRHLPHYQPDNATFHIVFRLAGSLPVETIEQLRCERELFERKLTQERSVQKKKELKRNYEAAYFEKFDALLDGDSLGPRWLGMPAVAEIVKEALHYRDGKEYNLLAYCIMPNHVHLVFTLPLGDIANVGRPDWSSKGRRDSSPYIVTRILENLKWYTALKCNKVLGRAGAFWQHESYDHVIRDGEELEQTIWYVLNNPVKAGLVQSWEQWQWTYVKPGLL